MLFRPLAVGLVVLSLAVPASAAGPLVKRPEASDLLSLLGGGTPDALAGSLRGYLVRNLTPALYEARPGWGQMKLVARGIEWKGQGLRVRPRVQYSHENDGTWRHILLTAENLADTLVVDLRNPQQPEPGRLLFTAFLSFDARVVVDEQQWREGMRLYASSARARLRVRLTLHCEATARLESTASLLPDAVFRLRVVHADVGYDNFVMEHLAGLGGEAAKLLGSALRSGVRRWDPALEPHVLARISAAIERAADTREVRVSLAKVFRGKT